MSSGARRSPVLVTKLALLLLLLMLSAHLSLASRCQEIHESVCQHPNLPYNMTMMPNSPGHGTQTEAAAAMRQALSAVPDDVGRCHIAVRMFFCMVYFPVCTILERPVPPCRQTCKKVRDMCAPDVDQWPKELPCDQLPNEGEDVLCLGEMVIPSLEQLPDRTAAATATSTAGASTATAGSSSTSTAQSSTSTARPPASTRGTSTSATGPGGTTTKPWNTTTQPWRSTTTPWNTTTQPWRSTTTPWNTTTQPWRSTTTPWNTTTRPWRSTTTPWNTTTQPWRSTTRPWHTTAKPWGSTTRSWNPSWTSSDGSTGKPSLPFASLAGLSALLTKTPEDSSRPCSPGEGGGLPAPVQRLMLGLLGHVETITELQEQKMRLEQQKLVLEIKLLEKQLLKE